MKRHRLGTALGSVGGLLAGLAPGLAHAHYRLRRSAMTKGAAAAIALLLALPGLAQGHALLHEVVDGEAVVLRLSFPGTDQPWFEPYEVFAPGGETPFQSGRVNALGEVSFRPDRPGAWRVRVFTEDGHGTVVEVAVDEAMTPAGLPARHGNPHHYWPRVLAGLGYLFGLFGLLALWGARRGRAAPG